MINVCRVQFILNVICETQKENKTRKRSSVANLYIAISGYINLISCDAWLVRSGRVCRWFFWHEATAATLPDRTESHENVA
jgi:hypothetical protein